MFTLQLVYGTADSHSSVDLLRQYFDSNNDAKIDPIMHPKKLPVPLAAVASALIEL